MNKRLVILGTRLVVSLVLIVTVGLVYSLISAGESAGILLMAGQAVL